MKTYFLKIVFAFSFFLLAFLPFSAFAGSEHNMSGWAWSSNIGWVSFNSTNTGGAINYGVNKNTDNTLTGYAWSSNIGWVKFGGFDTDSMPSGSGTQKKNAIIEGNNLKGWAKALSADGNGWDGWISLSGAGPSYGVSFSSTTGQFSSFAWGSDVVGWLSFNDVVVGVAEVCANGANNYPTCVNSCDAPKVWDSASSSCVTPPTCSDGLQNGNETGPDCGGSCSACNVDGVWSDWGACVGGIQTRICTPPSGDGIPCAGLDTQSCSTTPINGVCAATHYNCSSPLGDTGISRVSGPSLWTWICPGSNGGTNSPQCSQDKTPRFIED